MELVKNTCEPVIPRKLLSDDTNDRDHEALRKQKPKVKAVRDFPPGCRIKKADRKPLKKLRKVHLHLENNNLNSLKPNDFAEKPKVITSIINERKPLKVLDTVDTNSGKMNSCVMDKAVNSKSVQHDKHKSIEHTNEGHDQQPLKHSDNGDDKRFQPKEFGRNKPSVSSKEGEAQNSEMRTTTGSRKEHAKREKIKEAMSVFDQVYTQLLQDNRLKPKGEKIANWRVPVVVANITKQMLKWMEPEKSLGPICGVQIGDKFKYRSQLKMIGLHCQLLSGIDYTNVEGKNLAVSIVDSHRYSNESGSSDMLIYSGHGGLRFLGPKLPPEDQKLERGNLALKNSMDERTPVRVIRKVEVFEKNGMFVYDGLYVVKHYTQKRNEGRIEYKFHLNRVPGQPPLHQMMNASC